MKWLDLYVGGQRWGVYVVKGGSRLLGADDDETVHGLTHFDKCRIYLSKSQDEQAFEDTFLHELLHAAIYVSGASNVLASQCKTADKAADVEEQIVRSLTPILHRVLKDLGFRFPKQ